MQRLGEMQILNNHVDINNNNKKKQQRNQFLVSLRNSDLHDGWRSLLCPLICPCCPLLWHCCAAPARGRTPGPPDAESRPVSVGWPSVTGNSGSSSRPRQQPAASACRPAESHTRHTWEKIRSKEREKKKKKNRRKRYTFIPAGGAVCRRCGCHMFSPFSRQQFPDGRMTAPRADSQKYYIRLFPQCTLSFSQAWTDRSTLTPDNRSQ